MASRHTKLAEDSCRICIVFPKCDVDYINGKARCSGRSISDIVREWVTLGIFAEKRKAEAMTIARNEMK